MITRTTTRSESARLLRECLRVIEEGHTNTEIHIDISDDGTGRFAILITDRARTLDGADADEVDTVVICRGKDDGSAPEGEEG